METKLIDAIGYDLIVNEIPEGARVLDLGCGDGSLLVMLQKIKKVDGYGVEISPEGVSACVEKGLYVYQGDIDDGLSEYRGNSFDYVILNQTLHFTKRPKFVLAEIMRIGRNAIVSFPNLGFWKNRLHILCYGSMPQNNFLGEEAFSTINIHYLSIEDFTRYCEMHRYPIKRELHFSLMPRSSASKIVTIFPNFFAQYAFFVLDGEKFTQ
ncbi:MAG: methionine biosynthesis protein MetW [Spirochaetes bacterium]|nr:methionine biosynthesis protein MetW [Spirochaetota bacterium]